MKCKKSIMGLAALLIMIFHFYIPFSGLKAELVIYRAAYIGVDIFFFVSAYSLAQRDRIEYWKFVGNRLLSIYIPFVLFAVVANFYEKWKYPRFFKVIAGIEFFKRGGGSFLWFFVAIMLIYLIAPFLIKLKKRFGLKAFFGMLLGWLLLGVLCKDVLGNRAVFVLINRLPIIFIGMYYEEIRKLLLKKSGLPVIIAGLIAGSYLIYRYGSIERLNNPFFEIYYIIAIPFVISLILLWDYISSHVSIRNLPMQFIGRLTLELYGLQMIFGFKLETGIYKATGQKLITFLITAVCLIVAAYILYLIKKLTVKLIKKVKERKL